MLKLLSKLPLYWSYRRFGWPHVLPFSIVVSVSYRCNAKCQTCDVWRKPNDDLTLEEWDQVFTKIGRGPLYFTFTGGEPFLRQDTAEMILSVYRHCRPSVITVPTNGILTKRIVRQVDQICRGAPQSQIGINLSLDAIGQDHDQIRMVPGNWDKALKTWQTLKELQQEHKNLVLTTHTVISNYNIDKFFEIYTGLQFLEADSFITEIAEERVELDTIGWDITPMAEKYAPIADFLSQKAYDRPAQGLAKVTQSFRAQYYQMAKRTLYEHRQVIPCYAGWASCQIAPNGDIWSCCIRAEGVGNLREHGYDLAPIWRSRAMAQLRQSIYQNECHCPMANASYANMILHVPTVTKVVGNVLARSATSASNRVNSPTPPTKH